MYSRLIWNSETKCFVRPAKSTFSDTVELRSRSIGGLPFPFIVGPSVTNPNSGVLREICGSQLCSAVLRRANGLKPAFPDHSRNDHCLVPLGQMAIALDHRHGAVSQHVGDLKKA